MKRVVKRVRKRLDYRLFVSNKKFVAHVESRKEIKNIRSKYSKERYLHNLKHRGTLGTYLIKEVAVVINMGFIYARHKETYQSRVIETIVHETLHHVFYKFVGHYVNKEQEEMIMEMGFYTGKRKKLEREKKVKK